MNYFNDLDVKTVTRRTFFRHKHYPFTSPGYSIEYIKAGAVQLHIDSKTVRLEAPIMFWLGPAHSRYQYETISDNLMPYEHLWIDCFGERGKRIYDSLYNAFRNDFITLQDPRPVTDVFNEILRDFRTDKRKNHPAIVLNIEKLVYLLYKAVEKTPPLNEDRYQIMSAAEKIRLDPTGTFDLRKIASERGISPAYFRSSSGELGSLSMTIFCFKSDVGRRDDPCKRLRIKRSQTSADSSIFPPFPHLQALSRVRPRILPAGGTTATGLKRVTATLVAETGMVIGDI